MSKVNNIPLENTLGDTTTKSTSPIKQQNNAKIMGEGGGGRGRVGEGGALALAHGGGRECPLSPFHYNSLCNSQLSDQELPERRGLGHV